MQDALDAITKYTSVTDEAGTLTNPMMVDAVVRNIGIVGEAD